jgi:hypothetical protein
LASRSRPRRTCCPSARPSTDKTFRHPGLLIPSLEKPPAELGTALGRDDLDRQLSSLGAQSGLYDWRSGGWGSLVLSVPLLPGDGDGNSLGAPRAIGEAEAWSALAGYLRSNRETLRVDISEVAEPRVSVFDKGAFIQIYAARVVGGIPHARQRPHRRHQPRQPDPAGSPKLGRRRRRQSHGSRPWPPGSSWRGTSSLSRWPPIRGEPRLERVPLARGQDIATAPLGRGYDFRLAWVVDAAVDGDPGSWEGLVDAVTGELIAFQDTNAYAARRVIGGVYPASSDQQPPDGTEQPGWPMPYTDVNGRTTSFTSSGGQVTLCEQDLITTSLDGQYVHVADGCGPINETAVSGDINLGVSGGTDCVVPAGHSPGDTHAARTAFYQLNRMKEQARGYVTTPPGVTWLNGVLQIDVNNSLTCGGFWNGSTITTYRESADCRNFAEIAGLLDHELAHGLDDNDTNGSLSQPYEGAADVVSTLRQNRSCVGRGIFKNMVCGGYGDQCDGVAPTGMHRRAGQRFHAPPLRPGPTPSPGSPRASPPPSATARGRRRRARAGTVPAAASTSARAWSSARRSGTSSSATCGPRRSISTRIPPWRRPPA